MIFSQVFANICQEIRLEKLGKTMFNILHKSLQSILLETLWNITTNTWINYTLADWTGKLNGFLYELLHSFITRFLQGILFATIWLFPLNIPYKFPCTWPDVNFIQFYYSISLKIQSRKPCSLLQLEMKEF